ASDLRLGHVDEPDHITSRRGMCAEESLAPEDEVPRLGLKIAGDRRVRCYTAEVGQAHIAGGRRLRIYGLPYPRMNAVGPDEQIRLEHGAVPERGLDVIAGVFYSKHMTPTLP